MRTVPIVLVPVSLEMIGRPDTDPGNSRRTTGHTEFVAPLSFMPAVSENLCAWSLYPGLQQMRAKETEKQKEGGKERSGQIVEVARRARRWGKLGERLVVSDSSNRSGSNTCARAGPGGVYINTYKRRVNPGVTPVPRILEVARVRTAQRASVRGSSDGSIPGLR